MPTIKRLNGCRIEMYFADHGMPHFHVVDTSNRRASVAIASLEVLAGQVDARALREACDWAGQNRGLLLRTWKQFSE